MSILLLVLTANPTLIAIGQEETPTEESSEVTEEVAEEETTEEEITEETMTEEMMEEETMMMTTQVKPPKKQMDEGIEAGAVVCKEGLGLIIKASTGSAACVKSSSVEILLARGWGSTPA
ncbi:MAG: hypothetical protein WD154_03295 [Nitrosopumilaceae archaeon]